MAGPLSSYAIRLMQEGANRMLESLPPVLVWHAGAEEAASEDKVMRTMSGAFAIRPRSEDPLVLEVRKGSKGLNAFAMGVTVGRTPANDVVLADASISRFHAWLQQDREGHWALVDAESRNGTWVGPLRLEPKRPQPLVDGSLLRFGDLQLTFHLPTSFLDLLLKNMAST